VKRRNHRPALALLAIATAVALSGCQQGPDPASTDSATGQRPPASPSAAPTSRPALAQQASGRASSATTAATRDHDFGFIRGWYAKTGTIYLRFDRAVLLTGTAADAASAAHGGESPVPNDLYIQNDNSRLRDLAIADQAAVIGSQQLTGSPGPNPSSLKALLTFIHKGGPQVAATPFHLTYHDNGLVVRVQEQYLP
jgi:hypothetical protein